MISSSSNSPQADYAVIIVTYNSGDDIIPCLQSLERAHTGLRTQIIIVDNASQDATSALLQQYTNTYNGAAKIQVVRNPENRLFTAAVNQGLRLADAAYTLFLNPDTLCSAGCLLKLRAILENDSTLGVVAPQLRFANGVIQPSCRRFPRHRDVVFTMLGLAAIFRQCRVFNGWRMGDFDHKSTRRVEQPQGAFLLATRQAIEKVGEWDEGFPMFFSDVDWCRRLAAAGLGILFTPEVAVLHQQGKSVLAQRPAMIWTSHRSFVRYFWKHYPAAFWLFPNVIISILLYLTGLVRYGLAWLRGGISAGRPGRRL